MDLRALFGEKAHPAFHGTINAVQPLIRAGRGSSLHAELVLNSCVVTANVVSQFENIDYPPLAYGMVRSVLELVAGTLHLATNPKEVDDFQNFGKLKLSQIVNSLDPKFPLLENQLQLVAHFQNKRRPPRGKNFPNKPKLQPGKASITWHGMSQTDLIEKTIIESNGLFRQTSTFLHGDGLMAIAAMTSTAENGWQPKLFHPMALNERIPITLAIGIYSDLLFNVNRILELGCEENIQTLHCNMLVFGLPGYL